MSLAEAYDLLENGLADQPPLGPRGALAALAAKGRFEQPWLDLLRGGARLSIEADEGGVPGAGSP